MAAPTVLPRIERIGGGTVDEIAAGLGLRRPLVATDSFLDPAAAAEQMNKNLEAAGLTPRLFDGVVPDQPTEFLDAGLAAIREHGTNSVIGFGSGRTDTAKALDSLGKQAGQMRDYKAPPNKTATRWHSDSQVRTDSSMPTHE